MAIPINQNKFKPKTIDTTNTGVGITTPGTYGPNAPTVGNAPVDAGGVQLPSMPKPFQSTPLSAPVTNIPDVKPYQIQLPDYSKLAPLQDYSSQIGKLGQEGIQAGLQQLQELVFKPQYGQERERISSRGLTGAGVENEVLADLTREQNVRATQYVSEGEREIQKQQLQEKQQLRGLQMDRENMMLDQQMQVALAQGDVEMQTQLANQSAALEREGLSLQRQGLQLDFDKFNYSQEWDKFNGEMDKLRYQLEERGIGVDEELTDVQWASFYNDWARGAELKGQDYTDFMDAALGSLAEGGVGPGDPEEIYAGIQQGNIEDTRMQGAGLGAGQAGAAPAKIGDNKMQQLGAVIIPRGGLFGTGGTAMLNGEVYRMEYEQGSPIFGPGQNKAWVKVGKDDPQYNQLMSQFYPGFAR
jgi:hypothetical protein